MSKRRQELLAALEAEAKEHAIWQDGEDIEPTAEYWHALDYLLGVFEYGEIPGDLVPVAKRLDRLRRVYADFNATGAASPTSSFWTERDEVQLARNANKPELPALPSVAELVAQKVPIRQMCRFFWFMNGENPDTARMQREIDQPGSELTSAWLEYVNKKRLEQAGWHCEDEVREPPKPVAEIVAGIEQMIVERLSVAQIVAVKCRQYGISSERNKAALASCVASLANLMGVSINGSAGAAYAEHGAAELARARGVDVDATPLPAAHVPGSVEFVEPMELAEEDEPALSLDEQIAELAAQGHTADGIVDALGEAIPGTNQAKRVRKVERIIERLSQAEMSDAQ